MIYPVEQAASTLYKQATTVLLPASQFISGSAFGLYKVSAGHIASITLAQSFEVFWYGAIGGAAPLVVKGLFHLSKSFFIKQRAGQ